MTTKPPRTVKTPAQRAQEHVAVIERRLAKIRTARIALEKQSRDLVREESAITKRLEYARANPDLPTPPAAARPT